MARTRKRKVESQSPAPSPRKATKKADKTDRKADATSDLLCPERDIDDFLPDFQKLVDKCNRAFKGEQKRPSGSTPALYDNFEEGVDPPSSVALSDELVYYVTKLYTGDERGKRWPADFDKNGEIRAARVPKGPAPVIWAHGLPCAPIYRGYYALIGGQAAEHAPWLVDNKSDDLLREEKGYRVGPVVFGNYLYNERNIGEPGSRCDRGRQTYRQIDHHDGDFQDQELVTEKSGRCSHDKMAVQHHHIAMILEQKGYKLGPFWRIDGYQVKCSAHKDASLALRILFKEGKIDLPYAAMAELAYTNCQAPNLLSINQQQDAVRKRLSEDVKASEKAPTQPASEPPAVPASEESQPQPSQPQPNQQIAVLREMLPTFDTFMRTSEDAQCVATKLNTYKEHLHSDRAKFYLSLEARIRKLESRRDELQQLLKDQAAKLAEDHSAAVGLRASEVLYAIFPSLKENDKLDEASDKHKPDEPEKKATPDSSQTEKPGHDLV
ncbi:uncharacterized protein N7459_007355 [Penicillium hispanicum]|uniref:uncharacterized protein n=1 Tax=Penicillium hispanicum TaxID=1080232 RepID=UPI002542155A|nr:uncharacterized protein N7459_007355 [Penicillium hispanicum]KAJ5578391.1 hypothetical protein N7459_007355 [Penicillium hispanicum]